MGQPEHRSKPSGFDWTWARRQIRAVWVTTFGRPFFIGVVGCVVSAVFAAGGGAASAPIWSIRPVPQPKGGAVGLNDVSCSSRWFSVVHPAERGAAHGWIPVRRVVRVAKGLYGCRHTSWTNRNLDRALERVEMVDPAEPPSASFD
jgi:hypothetical protein